jgi:hypothetical protein
MRDDFLLSFAYDGEYDGRELRAAQGLGGQMRLNRDEIKSSPTVHSKIADSIGLAEIIEARLRG